jgi:hypothetical protein
MRPRHAGVQYDVVTQLFFLGLEKTIGVDLEGGGELDLVSRGIPKAFTALLAGKRSQFKWNGDDSLGRSPRQSRTRAVATRCPPRRSLPDQRPHHLGGLH